MHENSRFYRAMDLVNMVEISRNLRSLVPLVRIVSVIALDAPPDI